MRKGNAENAKLNGEYGKHVSKAEKRHTSKRRRSLTDVFDEWRDSDGRDGWPDRFDCFRAGYDYAKRGNP